MAKYTVHFIFECSPDTHWGIENDDEVVIEGTESYVDGEDCLDEDLEDSTISSWTDAQEDIEARWEGDSLSEYDYIDHQKVNPHGNGKSEFEDGTGDVNLEVIKVDVFDDDDNLIESHDLG